MFKSFKNQDTSVSQLDNNPISTVIGSEILFTGNIQGTQTIKIDGRILGNINVEKGIIIGQKAVIEGDLKSKTVMIYGEVNGSITCEELKLKDSGKVNGDILTNTIEIEMGGRYNGRLQMNQDLDIKSDEFSIGKGSDLEDDD